MSSQRTGAKSMTVFRLRPNPDTMDEYLEVAKRMNELAPTMPGYISHKRFVADDGERVTLVEFDTADHEQVWANHPEHAKAMALGRDKFFLEYNIKVCTVDRELVPRKS